MELSGLSSIPISGPTIMNPLFFFSFCFGVWFYILSIVSEVQSVLCYCEPTVQLYTVLLDSGSGDCTFTQLLYNTTLHLMKHQDVKIYTFIALETASNQTRPELLVVFSHETLLKVSITTKRKGSTSKFSEKIRY